MVDIHLKYQPLYYSDSRYFFITGGRGSGKSHAVHDFCVRLTYQQGERILFTRYTMTSAKKSIIPEFEDALHRLNVYNDFHITNTSIVNKRTGSEIMFSGIKTSSGDQTANLKSLPNITTWILEEAEDLTDPKKFDAIDKSIRVKGKQNRVIMIMNPATADHFLYKRWVEPKSRKVEIDGYEITIGNLDKVEYIHTTYLDNLHNLSKQFLQVIEEDKRTNPRKYEHEILGGWKEKADGVIIEKWYEQPYDTSLPYGFGLDFGYSDHPTALVQGAIDGQRYYLKQHLYAPGLKTYDIIRTLEEVADKSDPIIADRAEDRLIAEIWDAGFNIQPCIKGPGSVKRGIRGLLDVEICVDPESEDIKRELNLWRWNDKKAGVPIKEDDDAMDAARYLYEYLNSTPVYYTA